jgi:hypothetical protein
MNDIPNIKEGAPTGARASDIEEFFFQDVREKLRELDEIVRRNGYGIVLIAAPITDQGNCKRSWKVLGFKYRHEALTVLDSTYEWARECIENDPRLE